jgi:hypothetical protein
MAGIPITILLVGETLQPETVALRDLLSVLEDLDQLITRASRHADQAAKASNLTLARIERGSIAITLDGDASHVQGIAFLVETIAKDDPRAPQWLRRHARSLWRFAVHNDCEIRIAARDFVASTAFLGPHREPLRPPQISGETTMVATVLRAGGRRPPTAQLQLVDGTKTTIALADEAMARQLGERLYETVALEGQAVWNAMDWSLDFFTATRVSEYQAASVASTFAALAELAGSRWDDVDPATYVRSLRED